MSSRSKRCSDCGQGITDQALRCRRCAAKNRGKGVSGGKLLAARLKGRALGREGPVWSARGVVKGAAADRLPSVPTRSRVTKDVQVSLAWEPSKATKKAARKAKAERAKAEKARKAGKPLKKAKKKAGRVRKAKRVDRSALSAGVAVVKGWRVDGRSVEMVRTPGGHEVWVNGARRSAHRDEVSALAAVAAAVAPRAKTKKKARGGPARRQIRKAS